MRGSRRRLVVRRDRRLAYDLDEPARVRLGFTRGVPAGTTLWRLLTRLDAAVVSAVLADWLRTRVPPAATRPRGGTGR